jgi:hypothetical protein
MRRKQIGRLLGALGLAASLAYVAPGPAQAATPNWSMTAFPRPDLTANGADVVYQVTITNAGPSNISSLFLATEQAAVPVFLQNDPTRPNACPTGTSAPLNCSFGALSSGSVSILVGYKTPGNGQSFDPSFIGSTTGISGDKGHNSHGDYLRPSNNDCVNDTPAQPCTTTQLTSSKDFAGGFGLTKDAVSTNTSLGTLNDQYTIVVPPAPNLITTIDDSPGDTTACPSGDACFGQWSRLKVRSVDHFNDQVQTFPLFKVTLGVRANLVSGPQSSIKLVHVTDDGTVITMTQDHPCGTSGPLNCLSVKKTGNTYTLTTWVDQNGHLRGVT